MSDIDNSQIDSEQESSAELVAKVANIVGATTSLLGAVNDLVGGVFQSNTILSLSRGSVATTTIPALNKKVVKQSVEDLFKTVLKYGSSTKGIQALQKLGVALNKISWGAIGIGAFAEGVADYQQTGDVRAGVSTGAAAGAVGVAGSLGVARYGPKLGQYLLPRLVGGLAGPLGLVISTAMFLIADKAFGDKVRGGLRGTFDSLLGVVRVPKIEEHDNLILNKRNDLNRLKEEYKKAENNGANYYDLQELLPMIEDTEAQLSALERERDQMVQEVVTATNQQAASLEEKIKSYAEFLKNHLDGGGSIEKDPEAQRILRQYLELDHQLQSVNDQRNSFETYYASPPIEKYRKQGEASDNRLIEMNLDVINQGLEAIKEQTETWDNKLIETGERYKEGIRSSEENTQNYMLDKHYYRNMVNMDNKVGDSTVSAKTVGDTYIVNIDGIREKNPSPETIAHIERIVREHQPFNDIKMGMYI